MLAPYRSVLATPGALRFEAAGLVARMPISMIGLAIVLLVVAHTGSYGRAGAVSASFMVATAISSPVLGRLADTHGQALLLVCGAIGFMLGIAGLTVAVDSGWPTPVPHAFAAVTGATLTPVGAYVRARWTHALPRAADDSPGPLLHTAYSLEAVLDETIFITGPVIVTVLATQVSGAAAMAAIVVLAVAGGLWLASQRGTEPPSARASRAAAPRAAMRWLWLAPLLVGSLFLGSLFGSTEVAVVAFTRAHHQPKLAGLLLAVWAFGSLLAGLLTGILRLRSGPRRRFRLGALAMAAMMVPLPFVGSLLLLGAVLFVAGFTISPTLVASVSLIQAGVPATRLTEGITWLETSLALGVAPGAAVAGHLIDQHGPSAGFALSAVAGGLAALVAAVARVPHVPGEGTELNGEHRRAGLDSLAPRDRLSGT